LRSLREYAYAHSPFYQGFHQGLTDAPLHELPVLTKAMLMEHFDELVTDHAIRLKEVMAMSTISDATGSTPPQGAVATPAYSSSAASSGSGC